MKLQTKFDYSKINYSIENTVHCLITATAPKVNWEKERKPVNLVIVLDVSTSMAGDKLEYTKKSAMKLVDHLSPSDRLSIVTFSHIVTPVFEPTLMTQGNKEKFKDAIGKMYSSGSTNFSGALLEGLNQASLVKENCRVIMFTDGQPTSGTCNLEQILEIMKSNIKPNTTVSAFGYGDDHDSAFLARIAEIGKGNYAYVKNPDAALSAFAIELGGLLSCYAQNLVFTVTPKKNVKIEQVLTDVDVEELKDGAVKITLSDIYSEEAKNLVLEVKVSKQSQTLPREVTLLDVELKYDSTESKKKETQTAKAKVSFVKEADVQKESDKTVLDQLALVRLGKAQKLAKIYAEQGNYDLARATVQGVDLTGTSGNVYSWGSSMAGQVGSATAYFTNRHEINADIASNSSLRSTSLRSKSVYATTNAQDVMEKAFIDSEGAQLPVSGGTVQGGSPTQLGGDDALDVLNSGMTLLNYAGATPTVKHAVLKVDPPEKKKLSKKRSDTQW